MPYKHVNLPMERTKESYLRGQALACTIVKEKLDNFQVVLLGRHIQWCETILQNKNLNVCGFLKQIYPSTVLMILYIPGNLTRNDFNSLIYSYLLENLSTMI